MKLGREVARASTMSEAVEKMQVLREVYRWVRAQAGEHVVAAIWKPERKQ